MEYGKYMSKLDPHLKFKTYQKIGFKSVPSIKFLFNKAGDLCKKNPHLWDSLIVALLRGAVAKANFGSNAKTEERVVNFFWYVQNYDHKAAEVMSANLGGPGKRWLRKLDACERDDCILTYGKDGEKVVERMAEAIKRRSIAGKFPSFGLAVDTTKVSLVIEVSSGHKAIIGSEYSDQMIDI